MKQSLDQQQAQLSRWEVRVLTPAFMAGRLAVVGSFCPVNHIDPMFSVARRRSD